ncbi:MAG: O-antigen ligase family protein [Elusimicrobiota bacterium]
MKKIFEYSKKYHTYFFYLFAIASATSISAMTALLFIFLLFYFLNLKESFKNSPKDFLYFVGFYIWHAISDILNGVFSEVFTSLNNIWDKIPYVSGSALKIDKEKVLNFLKILLWVNVFIIVYALLQKYAGFPVIVKRLFTEDMLRFKGYHSHPLRFAGYLSTVCVIGISFGIFYSKKFLIPSLVVLCGIILNGSRSYWFSVVLTILILSLFRSFKTFIFYFIIVSVFWGSFYLVFPELKLRVNTAFNSPKTMEMSNMSLRINFWKAGIEIFEKNPIYGTGKGTITHYLKPYFEKGLIDNTAHCHNSYITSAAETGIIGVGFFVFIIFYFLRKYLKVAREFNEDFYKAFYYSLFGGWLNVALSGFFESNFSTFVLWGFLSVWMGIGQVLLLNENIDIISKK